MKSKSSRSRSDKQAGPDDSAKAPNPHATRETVESIVVAIILAFLFRGFVAEAFVIPTGSMAPTLRGRHMDITCPKCHYQYMTGASSENREAGRPQGEVTHTTCPLCRFTLALEKGKYPNDRSFNGDRILVSKFAYQLGDPRRWDVIVFKYPGNAKQNYIKRLVGLPGETIRIHKGDIHLVETLDGRRHTRIVRKPPSRLKSMLQIIDDTDYVAPEVIAAGCPPHWQPDAPSGDDTWRMSEDRSQYSIAAGSAPSWMRYRHLAPRRDEWLEIEQGRTPDRLRDSLGELITDHYSYNDSTTFSDHGTSWVGDLATEFELEVQSDSGELLLDLVEGGTHYGCRLDLVTGQATLSIRDFEGRSVEFVGQNGEVAATPVGQTSIKGTGRYRVRFANCDDQLVLWVNERVVEFDGPTTYVSPSTITPRWSPEDPGDAAPVGMGAKDAKVTISSLQVLRDIYYLAHRVGSYSEYGYYDERTHGETYFEVQALSDPTQWDTPEVRKLFESRRAIEFTMDEDEFFPLGDNSPQSKDARLWSDAPHLQPSVDRDLLIGKALLVYWPHGWRPPWPALSALTGNLAFIPNFPQMKLIR